MRIDSAAAAIMGNILPSFGRTLKFNQLMLQPRFRNATIKDIPQMLTLVNGTEYVRFTGNAMVPTLDDNETLLEMRRVKDLEALRPGDVIAMRNPAEAGKLLVRRITAVPGDELVSTEGKPDMKLEPSSYWVECDNDKVAVDSRDFGPVMSEIIMGRCVSVVNPAYNVTARILNNPRSDQEDDSAYLLSPEEVRMLLSQYEVVKPFMERFYPEETPPKGRDDDKEGENKPKKS